MLTRLTFTFVSVILLSTAFAACGTPAEQPEDPGFIPGMANPASLYCQGLGFIEETRENNLGQYGACLFPDGTECDTWDFLAGRCGQEHSYCVQQGFELEATEDGNIATCIFEDGSTCGEFLYYERDCQPGENLPEGFEESGSMPGMANPASLYCQGLGFTEETRENDLGQYGVCLFTDGTECDTWDFLAGRCGQEHSYCVQQGFELEAPEDGNIATCIFEDGSTCREFMYFQEECGP